MPWQLRFVRGHLSKRSSPPACASSCFPRLKLFPCKENTNEACRTSITSRSCADAAGFGAGSFSSRRLRRLFPDNANEHGFGGTGRTRSRQSILARDVRRRDEL